MAWSFAFVVLLGVGAGESQGIVVLPTRELCEATRSAVLELPPVARGTAVFGPCWRRLEGESEPPPVAPYGGGVS